MTREIEEESSDATGNDELFLYFVTANRAKIADPVT